MSTAILIALVVVVALFCPLMMWRQNRRGNGAGAACCKPRHRDENATELDTLHQRQQQLTDQIATVERQRAEESSDVITGPQ